MDEKELNEFLEEKKLAPKDLEEKLKERFGDEEGKKERGYEVLV